MMLLTCLGEEDDENGTLNAGVERREADGASGA